MTDRMRSRWVILGEVYLCMLSYAVIFQSIPPVMSLIIDHFRISHHEAGLLMSVFALPGILMSLPAGILADRYGIKPVGIATLALTIAGTVLVATGQTFASVLLGRIVAGTGAISLVIIAPQAIARWFIGREMGIAMGIFNTAMPVGTMVCLNALPALASASGWRSGIWVTVAFTAITLVVFALFYPQSSRGKNGKPKTKPVAWNIGKAGVSIWLVGAAWALFNASIISLFTFAPDFMVGKGVGLGSAGFYTSLVMIGSLVLSPVIGYLVDRVGRKEAFIATGGVGMALLLLLFSAGGTGSFALLMVAVGVTAALIPAPVFSLAADVVSEERLGTGYGILSMLNNVGIFVGPQLVGLSRDATGSYRSGFWLMALFAFLTATAIVGMWAGRRRAIPG
jgi:MFS family permease